MHFRLQTLLWWAVLVGFAAAAQNNQRSSSSGFTFKEEEDSAIEGSGYNGEVTHDLESSGSGFGPDDEDDPDPEKSRTDDATVILNNPAPPRNLPDPDPEVEKDFVETKVVPDTTEDPRVIMDPKAENRPTSFFAQPGILAAVIGGAVVGLLCAILVVMFIVYRMRKKDEGSYALGGEPKQSPNSNSYSRGTNKEFFA